MRHFIHVLLSLQQRLCAHREAVYGFRMRKYIQLMRLNKPIGIWLVFFPAAWGVAFAGSAIMVTLIITMLYRRRC